MNYRRFNIILLIALLLLGPLLMLVPWLRKQTGPLYPGCWLEQLMGRSCTTCGLTTGLRDLIAGIERGYPANPLTIPAVAIVLWEIVVRALLSLWQLPSSNLQLVKRWDIRLHGALLIAYLVYCAVFFVR